MDKIVQLKFFPMKIIKFAIASLFFTTLLSFSPLQQGLAKPVEINNSYSSNIERYEEIDGVKCLVIYDSDGRVIAVIPSE